MVMQELFDALAADSLWQYLASVTLGVTAVTALGLTLVVALRRHPARLRQAVLYVTVGMVLIAPLTTGLWERLGIGWIRIAGSATPAPTRTAAGNAGGTEGNAQSFARDEAGPQTGELAAGANPVFPPATDPRPAPPQSEPRGLDITWYALLLIGWAAGSAWCALRFAVGRVLLRRFRGRLQPSTDPAILAAADRAAQRLAPRR